MNWYLEQKKAGLGDFLPGWGKKSPTPSRPQSIQQTSTDTSQEEARIKRKLNELRLNPTQNAQQINTLMQQLNRVKQNSLYNNHGTVEQVSPLQMKRVPMKPSGTGPVKPQKSLNQLRTEQNIARNDNNTVKVKELQRQIDQLLEYNSHQMEMQFQQGR